jgi:hypothetical protein
MKTSKVPKTITLRDPISGKTGQVLSFKEYAYGHWFADQRWANPLTNVDIFLKCKREVDKEEGQDMNFEDADHAFFSDIVRSVPHEPALIYIQIRGFDDAILNAGERPSTTAK